MTEQPPTPEDVPASLEGDAEPAAAGEPTQAGVAPTEDAVAPTPEEAPPPEAPTVVDAPPPAAAPPVEPPPPPPPPPPPTAVEPPPPPVVPPPSFATDSGPTAAPSERPEIPIAGAFLAGFVLALILKRLAR